MTTEKLFIETLKDLEEKTNSRDPYDMLMAVALLRKLLLDGGNSLIYQVNKKYKTKVSFIVNDKQPYSMPGLSFWSVQDGFDPETSVPHLTRHISVNLDSLLKRSIMLVDGVLYNVQDFIKYFSHIAGSVHVGQPKDEKEKLLSKLETQISIGGVPGVVRSVQAIGRVVLKGLNPLRSELQERGY